MRKTGIAKLYPPSTIGIVGGGQLGRMVVLKAKQMGYNLAVIDPQINSPAGQIADKQFVADYKDMAALRELAQMSDVITYEFEHIDADLLSMLEEEGHRIYPSANTLRVIQNKYVQKCFLRELGVRIPKFHYIHSLVELKELFDQLGGKMILKTCQNGYDGKGNIIVATIAELESAYRQFAGKDMMAEEYITFTKELSILVARNHDGYAFYPIAENLHENSILIQSLIPASISTEIEESIQEISQTVVEALNDYGIFCIEFFLDAQGTVYINEIAPRPHNSGHYSIEACVCSQFEQLVRVICGMPLGSSKLRAPCAMVNILGDENCSRNYQVHGIAELFEQMDCHLHLYGKAELAYLKKIGHITALDDTLEGAKRKGQAALKSLKLTEKDSNQGK